MFMTLWVIPRCGTRWGRCWEVLGNEAVPGGPRVGPLRQLFMLRRWNIQAVERPRVMNCPSGTHLQIFTTERTVSLIININIYISYK